MANYAPRFFTHSMKRVPRIIDQFPNKLKFKARMTRNKWSHKAAVAGKLVILPEIDELEKIRDPHGFPKFLKQEIQGRPTCFFKCEYGKINLALEINLSFTQRISWINSLFWDFFSIQVPKTPNYSLNK